MRPVRKLRLRKIEDQSSELSEVEKQLRRYIAENALEYFYKPIPASSYTITYCSGTCNEVAKCFSWGGAS